MRKNLFIPLLLFSFGCSSGEMISEHQKNDPLVGTWVVLRIEGNENKDRVIYNPDGTWTSLISVLSDRDEIGYWVNISDSKDFNSFEQSYRITFKEQTNQITGIFDEDFNSFIYEIDSDVINYTRQVEEINN